MLIPCLFQIISEIFWLDRKTERRGFCLGAPSLSGKPVILAPLVSAGGWTVWLVDQLRHDFFPRLIGLSDWVLSLKIQIILDYLFCVFFSTSSFDQIFSNNWTDNGGFLRGGHSTNSYVISQTSKKTYSRKKSFYTQYDPRHKHLNNIPSRPQLQPTTNATQLCSQLTAGFPTKGKFPFALLFLRPLPNSMPIAW